MLSDANEIDSLNETDYGMYSSWTIQSSCERQLNNMSHTACISCKCKTGVYNLKSHTGSMHVKESVWSPYWNIVASVFCIQLTKRWQKLLNKNYDDIGEYGNSCWIEMRNTRVEYHDGVQAIQTFIEMSGAIAATSAFSVWVQTGCINSLCCFAKPNKVGWRQATNNNVVFMIMRNWPWPILLLKTTVWFQSHMKECSPRVNIDCNNYDMGCE